MPLKKPHQPELIAVQRSSQSIRGIFDIEDRSLLLALNSIVFKHSRVHASILTLKLECWRWGLGLKNEVVVTVRAILVTTPVFSPWEGQTCYCRGPPVFEVLHVFSEALLAFLTSKGLYSSIRERKYVAGSRYKHHVEFL